MSERHDRKKHVSQKYSLNRNLHVNKLKHRLPLKCLWKVTMVKTNMREYASRENMIILVYKMKCIAFLNAKFFWDKLKLNDGQKQLLLSYL